MAIGRPLALESGLILISKPRGMTSFGVVSRLRRLTGVRRIGHTGTLDPFAEGLLIVCLGRSTAVARFMDDYDKSYRVGIEFGRATDTQDLTGTTVFEHPLSDSEQQALAETDFAALRSAVAALPGEHLQLPPMYSAVKIEGKKLYEYARQGQTIERKSRPVRIDSAAVERAWLEEGVFRAVLRIDCSKGTYIRTIADDLGRSLGLGAHAYSLTRLRCGPFDLSQATDLDRLMAWRADSPDSQAFLGSLRDKGLLLPADAAFAGFPTISLPEAAALRLINGQPLILAAAGLTPSGWPPAGIRTVVYSRGCLIAVGSLQPTETGESQFKTERVLIDLADFRQS